MHPGLFIVFEGGDGAGKTTQIQFLEQRLRKQNLSCLTTYQPGATPVGTSLRSVLLKDSMSARTEALLYAADRAEHIETVVKPALRAGDIVLQDRYIDSSLAYQGAARQLNINELFNINMWATGNLVPDLTILLDIDPVEAAKRLKARGATIDRIEAESLEFHNAVRRGFLDLANSRREKYLVLDATQDPSSISEDIYNRIAGLIRSRNTNYQG